jgi:two-component system nitrogen regulation sensor histidine kinase GlnL
VHTDILDNLNTAILLLKADLSVSYINAASESLLDISSTRVIGQSIHSLFSEQDAKPALASAIAKNTVFTRREAVLNLSSGQQITVDYAVTPISNQGDNTHITSVLIELQPIDKLLRISRDEEMLSSQHQYQALVRGLAHEIKNPLGGIRGAAQLLAKKLGQDMQDYTEVIIEETDRLAKLVDELLGPRNIPNMQPLNIHEVLERVRNLVEAEANHQITVLRDYDPSIPELTGDKEQLIQATLNIARNAMQILFSAEIEHPQMRLKTRALRQFTIGSKLHRLVCQIEISDNGPGITEDLVDSIFLPLVTGRAEGTGLGLSISQSIINQHQGLIECHSLPGNTRFLIHIPLQQAH